MYLTYSCPCHLLRCIFHWFTPRPFAQVYISLIHTQAICSLIFIVHTKAVGSGLYFTGSQLGHLLKSLYLTGSCPSHLLRSMFHWFTPRPFAQVSIYFTCSCPGHWLKSIFHWFTQRPIFHWFKPGSIFHWFTPRPLAQVYISLVHT